MKQDQSIAPSAFSLSEFLPYRLAVISERVSRRLAVDYGSSYGLTVAEWRVLVHLQHCGVVSVKDIQVYTNLEKSRVSRAVSRLDAAALVEKRSSASDARLVEIALTAAGRAVLTDLLKDATAVEDRLLEQVDAADLATFLSVVEHLHGVLDADPLAKPRPDPTPQGPKD